MQLMKTQQVGPSQRRKEKTFTEEDRSENINGECLTEQEWEHRCWKNRDALTKEMTSDQIAEAQKMAREMVEANPKLISE
tara:strand:- start:198 stop:437 length:240 start_codon:yes stop_codon:yes gene_type:complete